MPANPTDLSPIPEVWNVNDCGKVLRRSPGAVRNLVLRKLIPYRKVAGRLVFYPDEIRTWIATSEGLSLEELRATRRASR
jgi:hypothetical protein